MAIKGFQDNYRWLSNFYPATIRVGEITYPTVEHAYVAAKTDLPFSPDDLAWFLELTPAKVKRVGRELDLRPDWEESKLGVMYMLTEKKYSADNPDLREFLLLTENEYIEETNYWGDQYWGVCNGVGCNNLGKIIMAVRGQIRKEEYV